MKRYYTTYEIEKITGILASQIRHAIGKGIVKPVEVVDDVRGGHKYLLDLDEVKAALGERSKKAYSPLHEIHRLQSKITEAVEWLNMAEDPYCKEALSILLRK